MTIFRLLNGLDGGFRWGRAVVQPLVGSLHMYLADEKQEPGVIGKPPWERSTIIRRLVLIVAVYLLLFGLHRFNYLLFHSVVEIFSVVVASAIFVLAWNARLFSPTSFLTILGMGYLSVAVLDFLHALNYPGMNIFPGQPPDAGIQLWIGARFVESLSLFCAAIYLNRTISDRLIASISLILCGAITASILIFPVFPTCFVPGKGLTAFKIASEVLIVIILLASMLALRRNRQAFEPSVWFLLHGAIMVTIASEIAFTLYTDVYGLFNMVGHYLKFLSFSLIYMAAIETGLLRPYGVVAHALKQKEASFQAIINATSDIVVLLDRKLRYLAINDAAAGFIGLKQEDILGRHISNLLPDEVFGPRQEYAGKVLRDGKPVQFEDRLGPNVYSNSIFPVFDQHGSVDRLAIFCKDITAEKKVIHALSESEAKFRLLADTVDGAFGIASVKMDRIYYASPGFEKIWKRSCSELYDDAGILRKTIHPNDRPRVMEAMRMPSEQGWEIDFRIVRRDGSIRWIHHHGYPVFDATGRKVKVCGMAHDITRQKQLEQRLLQSRQTLELRIQDRTEALSTAISFLKDQVREKTRIGARLKQRNIMLKTLIQSIPDMVSYKDVKGRYLFVNSAHRHFFGLNRRNITGRTDLDLKTARAAKESAEREQLVLKEGQAIRFESSLQSSSGRSSVWDIRKIPVKDGNGECMGILSLSREVTGFKRKEMQLKQSKSLLQAFLNGISDPMLMLDKDLKMVVQNRAAQAEFGGSVKGGKSGNCAQILCHGVQRCQTCKIEAFMARKSPSRFEYINPETKRIQEVHLYPLLEDRDGLDGAVVRIADITEAKQLERQLIHSEKMNALGMLVAGMVHEINNPNSFISFNLPILKAYLARIFQKLDGHPSAVADKNWFGMDYHGFRQELDSLTDNMAHGSSRIDNIISNLKAMIHPQQISSRTKWVCLDEIIDKAVMLCRGEIRKRVKAFEVRTSRHAIELNTDPEALEQVIINLLINASHAADKADSWVKIEARESKDLIGYAIIEISDNGCGMDQETVVRIFDPFFTTKGPGVGTGLGLSVSYNMVDQLGGEIVVDSRPGEGARFEVILPYENGAEEAGNKNWAVDGKDQFRAFS